MRRQLVCVGKIGAAHGLRGEVRLWSYTADPLAIADYGGLQSQDGARRVEIEDVRPAGDFLVARIKGVSDRAAAEELRNLELYVARDRLPTIEDTDEYYFADLVGLAAVDRSGAAVGEVVAVHNFGAGDLLELKLPDARDTVLIPFTAATVPEVDLAHRRVVVELPRDGQD